MRLASGFRVVAALSALGCELALPVHETSGGDASGSFCASQQPPPTFCDDFDEGNGKLDATKWSASAQDGEVTLDSKNFLSPGYSLASLTDPVDAAVGYAYALTAPFAKAPMTVHASFAVEMRSVGSTQRDRDLFVLQFGMSGGTSYAFSLQYSATDGLNLLQSVGTNGVVQYSGGSLGSSWHFPPNAWVTFEIDVDFTAGQLKVTIDQQPPIVATNPLATGASTGPLLVSAGSAFVAGPATEWDWGIDNVLVNAN